MLKEPNNIKKIIYIGLILTILLTWPVCWHFFSGIPGRGADTYQAIARADMVENYIADSGWIETFRWQKNSDFWGILPFIGYAQALLGKFAGYNLWWLLSFFLAFTGMWLLAKDIIKSRWAALASAFVFAFAPFHFSQATATNIGTMHYEWLPWLAFFLNRFFRTISWKNAAGAAGALILIVATEHQLLAFSLIFLIFYLPFLLFTYPEVFKKWRFWLIIALGLAIVFVIGAIQFGKIWEIAHSKDNYLIPPYSQVEDYSADLVDFFIPARFHPFWGEVFNQERAGLASNQEGRQSFYLGYLALILSFTGLIGAIKSKNRKHRRWIIFWSGITFLFFVLSLGPTLHIKGQAYFSQKLPYYWLYLWLPYWSYIRTVSRIFVVALLGFSLLVGYGIKFLEKIIENKAIKPYVLKMLIGICVVGLPLEYLSLPVSKMDLAYSPFYDKIAKDTENYSILEIPGATSYDFGSYTMYLATIHHKNKIDGIDFARREKDRWNFQRNTPIINTLLYSLSTGGKGQSENVSGGDIIITDYAPIARSIFNFYNIRYIVVSKADHSKKFGLAEYENTVKYLEQNLGLFYGDEDEFLKAYPIPRAVQGEQDGVFMAIDTGSNDSWGEKEGAGKSRARWAATGAKTRLVNTGQVPADIEIKFKARIKYLRHLEILLDGAPIKNIFIKEFKGDYSFPVDRLTPGEHALEFKITDENNTPATDFTQSRGVRLSQFETVEK